MAKNQEYQQNEDGTTTLIKSEDVPDPVVPKTEGIATLVATTGGARITIQSPSSGIGVPVITRIQDKTTNVGTLYIYDANTIDGVSFEVRSTNANDTGSFYWSF